MKHLFNSFTLIGCLFFISNTYAQQNYIEHFLSTNHKSEGGAWNTSTGTTGEFLCFFGFYKEESDLFMFQKDHSYTYKSLKKGLNAAYKLTNPRVSSEEGYNLITYDAYYFNEEKFEPTFSTTPQCQIITMKNTNGIITQIIRKSFPKNGYTRLTIFY